MFRSKYTPWELVRSIQNLPAPRRKRAVMYWLKENRIVMEIGQGIDKTSKLMYTNTMLKSRNK